MNPREQGYRLETRTEGKWKEGKATSPSRWSGSAAGVTCHDQNEEGLGLFSLYYNPRTSAFGQVALKATFFFNVQGQGELAL